MLSHARGDQSALKPQKGRLEPTEVLHHRDGQHQGGWAEGINAQETENAHQKGTDHACGPVVPDARCARERTCGGK